MTTRTLYFMTALVLLGMAILLGINLNSILTGEPQIQTYLKFNEVRGMAVGHNHLLYTLNFDQQNKVISILNRAIPLVEVKTNDHQKPDIDKIVVYQFNQQAPITITPIVYDDNNLVFSTPNWNNNRFLMELSNGELKELLSQTYDP